MKNRSTDLERERSLRLISDADRDLTRLVNDPKFSRWLAQIKAIGGCAHPIYLSGSTLTLNPVTGEVVSSYSTADEPAERLAVRCGNRRASVCPTCSYLHAGDTYQLMRAGLSGGKGVPGAVTERPRLFVTLTAPSFGPVHHAIEGQRCRPRRDDPVCEHGRPLGCGRIHGEDDRLVGLPLCPDCYDYVGHVLWHAHAGRLWNLFTTAVRRSLASAGAIPRSKLGEHLVVSFAKVAEYQKRAAIHFHGVVRLDGPDGPGSAPAAWAGEELLTDAVTRAAASTFVTVPESDAYGTERLGWGGQFDARPIHPAPDSDGPSGSAVAGYVAKYVTKGAAETGAGLDYRITTPDDIRAAVVTTHIRALMATCWRLGGLAELEHLRLRRWAHSLGYRGHILTKSRRYSTTYGALRADRADHRRGGPAPEADTITESAWRFAGSGYTPAESDIAVGIAEDLAELREIRRDMIAEGWKYGAR
ncbi:plasmid replication initiator protein [Streptomyces caeruleatus]|uniref:Plasmid replication initiator protein n=1 Tax=Streptomyces caeruleatus TaxID=661399 RepID=A0A101TT89_9ACTN|nr:replication initiator [Streptomyces caeruleatus]KUN98050.1 plasmid replication initiator protein [Streptomyces caeruleatus]